MSCPVCGSSANQEEFSAEMMFHFTGVENLDRPGVIMFPKVLVCLDCDFSQFNASETELTLIAKANRRLTALRGWTLTNVSAERI
jgi:hypothetical protein